MARPDDIAWSLIAKYLAGDATPDEIEIVERWAASDPLHAAELAALRAPDTLSPPIAASPSSVEPTFDVDAAWAKSPVVRAHSRHVSGRHPRMRMVVDGSSHPARRFVPWLVAAAILVATPFAWRVVRDRRAELSQVASTNDRIYETRKGERSKVELADGTTIAMAAETRLRVSARYGDDRRDVFLTGEALFDVTHDAARPFAVHVGDLVAQDLGTQFGVRAYEGKRLQIVVAKGAVSLGVDRTRKRAAGAVPVPDMPAVTLSPGDLGQLDSAGHIQLEHGVDVTRYLGWSEGTLQYQLAPLSEIINDLDRWYDVDIRLADSSLGSTRVTMQATGKSVDDVMAVLAAALALRFDHKGRIIRMY